VPQTDKLWGPYEYYGDFGQLKEKGTYDMGNRCGEWIEDGETVPHNLADGN
jgi:hypothetical protein